MPELVMEAECQPIRLEPFVHQVGGHSGMLRFDDKTLCKPLISRERHFYETLPAEMKEFVPDYRGVIGVTFHEDSDGYMTLTTYPSESKSKHKRLLSPSSSPSSSGEGVQSDSDSEQIASTSRSTARTSQRFRMRRSGSIEMEGNRDVQFQQIERGDKKDTMAAHNPWSLRCHKEQLAKMRKNNKDKGKHKFILLENLTSNFRKPCILDLKMGTRQHGDDVSEAKRESKILRCASTTSSTLGIRICGMQVYQETTGRYVCHNKYYGRQLTEEGVQDTLFEFLYNGYMLRSDLIDPILERLRQLHAMLGKQNTYRFYSSSLLIMYDGCMIENGGGPIRRLALPLDEDSLGALDDSQSEDLESSDEMDVCGATAESHSHMPWETVTASCSKSPRNRHIPQVLNPHVDVRMIDFAHTTHQGFRGDRTLHSGPDRGYQFGLENLIHMFEQVKKQRAS